MVYSAVSTVTFEHSCFETAQANTEQKACLTIVGDSVYEEAIWGLVSKIVPP
jgi:hypothetical protein